MAYYILTVIFVTTCILVHHAEAELSTQCAKTVLVPEATITMYNYPPSPPSRAVRMLAQGLNLDLNLVMTDIMAGDQMKEAYLEMNPQHTVPTLDDNGFILWESRAIMAYLVNAYGQSDTLYPAEPRQRALVDQQLYFDQGTLFSRYLAVYNPMTYNKDEPRDESKVAKIVEAIGYFNSSLQGRKFAAGDNLTIADISIAVTFSNLEALGHDFSQFPNVQSWFEKTKAALEPFGYKEINVVGAQMIASFFKKD